MLKWVLSSGKRLEEMVKLWKRTARQVPTFSCFTSLAEPLRVLPPSLLHRCTRVQYTDLDFCSSEHCLDTCSQLNTTRIVSRPTLVWLHLLVHFRSFISELLSPLLKQPPNAIASKSYAPQLFHEFILGFAFAAFFSLASSFFFFLAASIFSSFLRFKLAF